MRTIEPAFAPSANFVSIVPGNGGDPSGGSLLSSRLSLFEAPPPKEEKPFEGLTAIGPTSDRKAREWSLVLQSSETWHVVRSTPSGFVLLVRDAEYEAAATSIDRYEVENKDFPPPRPKEQARFAPSAAVPFIFLALAAFFMVTGPAIRGSAWFQQGTAVTELVLSSEPWRAVTALTLHADTAHLLGNAISGTVFASAVHRRLGPGGGSLAILAAGTFGNIANAVYHVAIGQSEHRSIGASTAIFGAIGVLAATQLFINRRKNDGQRGFLSWAAPVVGGFALLGALGAGGARTDLGAHLFGLLAGGLIGAVAGFLLRDKLGTRFGAASSSGGRATGGVRWQQVLMGATALGVVIGSWLLAARTQ